MRGEREKERAEVRRDGGMSGETEGVREGWRKIRQGKGIEDFENC
jgi:hypothetical protein